METCQRYEIVRRYRRAYTIPRYLFLNGQSIGDRHHNNNSNGNNEESDPPCGIGLPGASCVFVFRRETDDRRNASENGRDLDNK